MILADACILIDYERAKDAKLRALVPSLSLAVAGVTRSELLGGAQTPAKRAKAAQVIRLFFQQPTPEAVWDEVGDHLAMLRTAGVVVPYQDVVLASLGVHLNVEVWSRDAHFRLMQAVLPRLRLYQEPP